MSIYIYIYTYIHICINGLITIVVTIPLPRQVLQTPYCSHWVFEYVIQTGFGMGMGMNGTAQ